MLTGIPINLGGKTKRADWDNFILRVINPDLKLKDMVLCFLPACTSVKQFTTKLRESLLLANPHGILFLPKKPASFHVKPSSPTQITKSYPEPQTRGYTLLRVPKESSVLWNFKSGD